MLLKVLGADAPPTDVPPGHKGYWKRASFSVPADIPDARVQLMGHKYAERAAAIWALQGRANGLQVHHITPPVALKQPGGDGLADWRCMEKVTEDRRKYVLFGYVSERPRRRVFDVPDALIPDMERLGLRLT